MFRLTGHKDVEVRPDHRLLLCCDNLQHLIDVGLGNFVTWVWHRGMAFALTDKPLALPALCRYLNHLIINHTISQRNIREERQQIGANRIAIDRLGLHRMDDCRQVYHIDVNKREAFYQSVTHFQTVIGTFQVCHTEWPFLEIKGHKAVKVFVYLLPVQQMIL